MQLPFELDVLSKAHQYQQWIFDAVKPYLGKRIVELGAGIGNLSQWLPERDLLLLTEVETSLIDILKTNKKITDKKTLEILQIDLSVGLAEQIAKYNVDTIVSFNVMEHLEDDLSSIAEQVQTLKNSNAQGPKRLVIFVPAHPFAYGSLDRVFKHHRRYNIKMVKNIFRSIDPSLKPKMNYFNVLSFPGWIVQGRVMKTTEIKEAHIDFLEKIIPLWRPVDAFLTQSLKLPFGQSLVCVVDIP